MSAIDAYIDPTTGDLPAITRLVTGLELIQQRIRMRLNRGDGEWFLDPVNVGLPLIGWRQAKPPDATAIALRIEQEIRTIPGVTRTANFVGVHDHQARRVTVTGDVVVDDGSVTSVVVLGLTGDRNTMSFGLFFSTNGARGGPARPSLGRP